MNARHVPATDRLHLLRRLAFLATAAAWLSADRAVSAHAIFMTYIQHRATVAVGPTNTDLTIELTFFETRSMTERRRMDANQDDTITSEEIQAYVRKIAGSVEGAVRFGVAGRSVDLFELYEPQVDLLGVNEVAPCHHVLRLFYFARTPEWLAPGGDIEIEDNLWPQAASIGSFEANGEGGFRVAAMPLEDGMTSGEAFGKARVMRARCTAVAPRIRSQTEASGFAGARPRTWRNLGPSVYGRLGAALAAFAVIRVAHRRRPQRGKDASRVLNGNK